MSGFLTDGFHKRLTRLEKQFPNMHVAAALANAYGCVPAQINRWRTGKTAPQPAPFELLVNRVNTIGQKAPNWRDWNADDFFDDECFFWFKNPNDLQERDNWEAFKVAYNDIFYYQPERDPVDNFNKWAVQSDDAERFHSNDSPHRCILGGVFEPVSGCQYCAAVFHTTINLEHKMGLVTYLGIRANSGYDGSLFTRLLRSARKHVANTWEQEFDYVYEVDQPDSVAWKAIRAQKKEAIDLIERSVLVESARCIRRLWLFLWRSKSCLLRDSNGELLDYEQPDMRPDAELTTDRKSRPMWLCISPGRSGISAHMPGPVDIISFMYGVIYGDLYRNLLPDDDTYWAHADNLRKTRQTMAKGGSVSPSRVEIDVARNFLSQEYSDIWSEAGLRH